MRCDDLALASNGLSPAETGGCRRRGFSGMFR